MAYERNERVRYHKLQKLRAEFETMTMAEDEFVEDFYSRLIKVTNEFDRLHDPIAEHRIVEKFLEALPSSFHMKVTVIEEVKDLNTYPLDELLANLETYEARIRPERKERTKAWYLHHMTYDGGNKKIREHKLEMLTAEYEKLEMENDEFIDDFYSRLINITDAFERLGKPFPEHRIVKKFLRALPPSFRMKVTVIEEFKDLNTYPLDELLANLESHEADIRPERKERSKAWYLLHMTYDGGNKKIRDHKLWMLTAEYEKLKMENDESIDDFYSRLINITDSFERLGKPFPEHEIVKKFLRAFPSRSSFRRKVNLMMENRDINTYPLDEFLAELQTYEAEIRHEMNEKTRETLKENDSDTEFTAEELARLLEKYKKFIKSRMSSQDQISSSRTSCRRNPEEHTKSRFTQKKLTKCFECQGIGHVAAYCANRKLKARSNKAKNATWSAYESETDSDAGEEILCLTAALVKE